MPSAEHITQSAPAARPVSSADSSLPVASHAEHTIIDTFEDDDEIDYEALPENTSLAANLMAGAFAGIMEHTVMYPVDAIKTRMQVASQHSHPVSRLQINSGILSSISRISATEGAMSLWRGITSVVVGAGPAHAVYFAIYESVKTNLGNSSYFKDPEQKELNQFHHPIVTAVAGASATISSDALMNPFDVIKQRMQLPSSIDSNTAMSSHTNKPTPLLTSTLKNSVARFKSVPECASWIYRNEGFAAFYVSYPTTLAMNIPFTAINFTTYEYFSKIFNPTKTYDPLVHCVAGGLAGATAAALTTPLDVIKTFLQTKGLHHDAKVRSINSFWGAAKIIHNQNGPSAFLRGLKPRVVANMPSTAISWTSYEMAKFYFYGQAKNSSEEPAIKF
ncbi:RNA splicing protein and member of the mitochondrial carrier family [Nadsonia fulvescens var. elongata DSM 6958]|uniref:RNA splicing protein and member of the mitochondrial carrier family n=1 Tax=Nadsonia fulvescens var. elongata DSM 6958 TaxID=857566 RepID=A0A1E3PJY4_9ASCO|nr:RNA splicing protein and member of the mitochondrial carrier family [Nadsonia fulvescens var. elongata DSM 6958]